ncbi:Domain of uncharacterised function (DUF955) [Alloiococcus otitis]|uniref:IrrE N-terminal-like domain-containing protein n=1 Tax=Alloiococcus otitis ATCC 51267 TaxID=883081 RepID=K9EC79_9LACT|nr:ImmA/IrrE family metallo-endopeptidase [Alloiococcus otitis]EKU93391.1 hypothetical protein HMPREF9698_01139 [Alloiococcus otitis ATCC 51267]SUU81608.1 Domain of uncharacterised function (DUF955) [Alloiococcus otitis]
MDRLEKLIDEYHDELSFEFRSDMPDSLSGLIVDNNVFINSNIDRDQAYIVLAEEIGHYETSSPKDITNYKLHRKEEIQARRWSYKKVVPVHYLKKYSEAKDKVYLYQIAEELDLPEDVIEKSIEVYKLEGKL